jgi:aspartate aminotransferase
VVRPENVIASSGAKQSIMVALHALLDPKDEVIVPVPYWVSYPEMVKLAGGVPVPVRAADGSFEPSIDDLLQAVGPYTKAILLNSPNNPSGAMYADELVRQVVRFAEERDIWVLMDDTYNRLVFDGRQPTNAYSFTDRDVDDSKLVIVNSVSKIYAMTGFRVGWAVGNRELVRAMTNIQSQQTSGPATPSQWAAVGALNGVQNSVDALRLTLQNNRDVLVSRLQAIPGVKVVKPAGTFYTFPDFSAYEKDSQKLAGLLLDKVRVVVVPGREFGMDGHLRISFCGTLKEIREGVERIQWALDPHAPNELFLGSRRLVRDWL